MLPITNCPDGSGSLNNPANMDNLDPSGIGGTQLPKKYVAPDLCVGELTLNTNGDDKYQEQIAAENLNISGAPLNVFKLLGVHEQGRLVDIVGNGFALNGSDDAFDVLAANWTSVQTGLNVLTTPAWMGYDFGTTKTSYGQDVNAPGAPAAQHITSFRIVQPTQNRRALQVRVERSTGTCKAGAVQLSGAGNGTITGFTPGAGVIPGTFMVTMIGPTTGTVWFTRDARGVAGGPTTSVLGVATVGVRFNSMIGSFTVTAGTAPFSNGDLLSLPILLDWYRVDVVNLPDSPAPMLVRIKQSSASRFWRLVPVSFSGATTGDPWEVQKLELFDYQATTLDDVQDALFLENRDRDYSNTAATFKVAYQPFDAISDLSKFGFQVSDIYSFTTVYALMIKALGRPIVIGDVIEVPSEMQYDHNLRPVRKFLEVSDVSWASDGYTTQWRPITFKFQASQLIPSQEHRDLLGTIDTQKYTIDDGSFFDGIEQIQTGPLTASEAVAAEALAAVPEKGTNIREVASGMDRFNTPGSYDGTGPYVSDGLPPDGQDYMEGFKLPDVASAHDGDFFRLNYDPALKIGSRLYKFSAIKNQWLWVETDRRSERSSHKPSQREIFDHTTVMSMTTKKIT
jgi:hypothetical protein